MNLPQLEAKEDLRSMYGIASSLSGKDAANDYREHLYDIAWIDEPEHRSNVVTLDRTAEAKRRK